MADINSITRAFLTRKEAAAYLAKNWFPISARTLATHAVNGTGPIYQARGRDTLYTTKDLDRWAATPPSMRAKAKPTGALSAAAGRASA